MDTPETVAAAADTTYRLVDGRVVVQVEDLLGTDPTGGWMYQAPGVGNPGAVGAHYYYRSETADGSNNSAPQDGRFSFQVEIDRPGSYSILLRAARDTNDPGDARNDIWIQVDGDTAGVMPADTPGLTPGGDGFVKFKGGLGVGWRDANQFSTPEHGDVNPRSTVLLDAGVHSFVFAPRSTGLHIDSVQIVARETTDPPPEPPEPPEPPAAGPLLQVWLSHDGYRDPDDNLAMLLGAAQARAMAGDGVRVAGVVFGDTKDGGQFNLLNPEAATPAAFGEDPRYGDVAGNERAAGNYAFFREYGRAALGDLGPGWNTFDLLADDAGGLRPWNFHATGLEQISAAAAALALDVADAIALTAGAETAAKLVVYSAGGGANVAAEAVGYLLGQGYAMADLVKHFAVVQHGNNWVTNYEDEARALTRELTIAISNQNYDVYADGSSGPDLKHAIPPGSLPDGSGFGAAFAAALAVATGGTPFAALPEGARFRTTLDASDAGSHAFATDRDWLLAAWGDRVGAGELHTGLDWAHLIDDGPLGLRDRVLYDGFDAAAIAALLAAGKPAEPEPVTVSAAIAASGDDHELIGGGLSVDLDLGGNGSAAGWVSNPAGLRFTGLALDPGAAIVEAYFLFQAKTASTDVGGLVIELEASRAAAGFAAGPDPFAARSYLAETVAWDAPGAWTAGQFYRTPDLSGLLATLLADDGLGAEEALGFRVSGTGARSAYSFDSPGAAPRLVITTVAEPDPALPDPDLALPLPDDLV